MNWKKRLGLFGLGLAGLTGLTAYLLRRRMIGRVLHLDTPKYSVVVRRGITIPMHDGVTLLGDHYTPKGERLYPTVLIRTPYGRGRDVGPTGILHDFIAQRFAERGYNVVVQDVRGCYESEGDFEPFTHEADDGRATLKWIEKQPWFNGVLGMWGPSYLGYVQWAVAGDAPLYLKAIVPVITGANIANTGFRDGSLSLDTILRWIIQIEALDRKSYYSNWFGIRRMSPKRVDKIITKASNELPLKDIDKRTVGKEVPFLREWMSHLTPDDPYWEQFDLSPKLPSVTASTHLVSGWYDVFLRETLEDYERLKETHGRRPYLTIGPWHHLDTNGLLESLRLAIIWFDVYLKGEGSKLNRKPIRIYVMGRDVWCELDHWPPKSDRMVYFLHRNNTDPELIGHLTLNEPEGIETVDHYIFDPEDPTPAVGGAVMNNSAGVTDNNELESRSDVLTYTTSELDEDIEIIGSIKLQLFVRSSLENTDFFGRICDVHPDGRSNNICDGFLRVDPDTGVILEDGSKMVEFDFWPTAIRFSAGHKIRLQVSSGAHPRWYRNLGTDQPIDSTTDIRIAEQSIYHDIDHPSKVILPVIR